eukprot:scaffold136025_cov14-Tisochrysis_lutea.AAC.1
MRLRGWDVGPTSSSIPSATAQAAAGLPRAAEAQTLAADPHSQLPQSAALRTAAAWEEAVEAPLGANPLP